MSLNYFVAPEWAEVLNKKDKSLSKEVQNPGTVVHACNPSTQEADAGGF
jgi:hypothetical protein